MRHAGVLGVLGLVLSGFLVSGLSIGPVEAPVGAESRPGPCTLESGAFAVEPGSIRACSELVERSPLWQAYLGWRREGSGSNRPAATFTVELARDIERGRVTAKLKVMESVAGTRILLDGQEETVVRQPQIQWRGAVLATLSPFEGDFRSAEAHALAALVDRAALAAVGTRPAEGHRFAPVLFSMLRRESLRRPADWQAGGPAIRSAILKVLVSLASTSEAGAAAVCEGLKDREPEVRLDAAHALREGGTLCQGAAPALGAALDDADARVRAAAAGALGAMGPEAVPVLPRLVEALGDAGGEVRTAAYSAIVAASASETGVATATLPAFRALVRPLAAHLDGAHGDTPRLAALVLGRIGPHAAAAVPGLVAALSDTRSPAEREAAARTLARIGGASAPAVPALIGALGDGTGPVALAALLALGAVGPPARAAVTQLALALSRGPESHRTAAAQALAAIGPAAAPAVRELAEALGASEPPVREAAARALGRIGHAARVALPGLVALFSDPVVRVIVTALEAVRRVDVVVGPLASHLVRTMDHRNPDVRWHAVRALDPLQLPLEALEPLVRRLRDAEPRVMRAATEVLATAARSPVRTRPIVEALVKQLDSEDAAVRERVGEMLASMGEAAVPGFLAQMRKGGGAAESVAPYLVKLPSEARRRTAEALGALYPKVAANAREQIGEVLLKFGADAAPAVETLVDALAQADPTIAADTLAGLGSVAVRELISGLDDERDAVRVGAARVLGQIGPAARSAVPALLGALADDAAREAAMVALCRISAADPAAVVPPILDEVGRLRPEQCEPVSAALAGIGAAAVPALAGGLKHGDATAAWTAARALGSLGSAAQPAITELEGAARHADRRVARAAAQALERVRPAGQEPSDRTGGPDDRTGDADRAPPGASGASGSAPPAGGSAWPAGRSAWPVARSAWPGAVVPAPDDPSPAPVAPPSGSTDASPRSAAPSTGPTRASTGPSTISTGPSTVSSGPSTLSTPASPAASTGSPSPSPPVPGIAPSASPGVAAPPDDGLYMDRPPPPTPPGTQRGY
jgi:HEAT repeat protein